MRCPSCGLSELTHETRDLSYSYKGRSTVVLAVEGDYCPACGEVVLDYEQSARYMDLISLFRQQVDSADTNVVNRPTTE